MPPIWGSLAYTEADNQSLKKSFLGESGCHTGEESLAVFRQATGDSPLATPSIIYYPLCLKFPTPHLLKGYHCCAEFGSRISGLPFPLQ